MTDDEGGKKTSLGLLDLDNPSLPPFVFEVEEVVGDLVVCLHLLHGLLGLVRAKQIRRELFHWCRSAMEEVTRPGDRARDDREVSDDQRCSELPLVLILNLSDEARVAGEEKLILALEASLQVVAM